MGKPPVEDELTPERDIPIHVGRRADKPPLKWRPVPHGTPPSVEVEASALPSR
jgi:hypothetical protein